jgi:P27 family predicted phage terminase small subunit
VPRSPRGVGRKPAPTELLKLRGSFNPTLHGLGRQFEPKPLGDLDEPPPDLTDSQEDIWRYAIGHMPRGVMKKIDRDMLRIWVEASDRHNIARQMQAMLDQDSRLKLLIKTPNGFEASPYNDILDKTAKTMIRVAQELGFSPAARPRLKVDPPPIEGTVAEEPDLRTDPWAALALPDIDGPAT